ncbi:DUF1801 domain-containing protein [Roseovarius sp. Pro17]|uniref:DUF1801 domain-containing protein n=1 Tax=Roseovarius sp. Pro17 TaxID=3108175 RepID=UPI002D7650DC|nr:DUF1801 domain-containing protein [Roseovarius sp. Pro17]
MSYMKTIPPNVLQAFQEVSPPHRKALLDVRQLIFDVAGNDPRIGPIEETLRWGEPAYVTTKNKTGSTIRLGIEKISSMPALFFNCNTTLVEEFRQQFGGSLTFSKNRAVILDGELGPLSCALKTCIAAALTYHLRD